MPKAPDPSLLKELKDKYLELNEIEEELEEIIQLEYQNHSKLPRRVKDFPKTIHHPESSGIISDTQL